MSVKSCVVALAACSALAALVQTGAGELVRVASAQTNFDVHGYVEPCALEYVGETHLECELCNASLSSPNACSERFASRGFEKRCRARGGHDWNEVWCLDLRKKHDKTYNFVLGALLAGLAGAGAFVYFKRSRRKRT
jgi:hypothetical protein